jgi:hypothetical protein
VPNRCDEVKKKKKRERRKGFVERGDDDEDKTDIHLSALPEQLFS